jgi:hypothetical protein
MTRRPAQLDLFTPVEAVPARAPVAPVPVPDFDFPDSDAYAPRGIESVPGWLLLPTDEVS